MSVVVWGCVCVGKRLCGYVSVSASGGLGVGLGGVGEVLNNGGVWSYGFVLCRVWCSCFGVGVLCLV